MLTEEGDENENVGFAYLFVWVRLLLLRGCVYTVSPFATRLPRPQWIVWITI